MYVCIYIYIYVCVFVTVYIYIYIYIYIILKHYKCVKQKCNYMNTCMLNHVYLYLLNVIFAFLIVGLQTHAEQHCYFSVLCMSAIFL